MECGVHTKVRMYRGCFNLFCNVGSTRKYVCTVVVLTCFIMCGCFGNMCTCIYCVLYCLYYVFALFRLCIFILIFFCLYWCNDDLYSLPNIVRVVKSRRMRWAGHVARMGEDRGVHRVLVGKPEGKRPLGRPRRRWEDNIKMDLQKVGEGRGD